VKKLAGSFVVNILSSVGKWAGSFVSKNHRSVANNCLYVHECTITCWEACIVYENIRILREGLCARSNDSTTTILGELQILWSCRGNAADCLQIVSFTMFLTALIVFVFIYKNEYIGCGMCAQVRIVCTSISICSGTSRVGVYSKH
jgi:hypothetical protein